MLGASSSPCLAGRRDPASARSAVSSASQRRMGFSVAEMRARVGWLLSARETLRGSTFGEAQGPAATRRKHSAPQTDGPRPEATLRRARQADSGGKTGPDGRPLTPTGRSAPSAPLRPLRAGASRRTCASTAMNRPNRARYPPNIAMLCDASRPCSARWILSQTASAESAEIPIPVSKRWTTIPRPSSSTRCSAGGLLTSRASHSSRFRGVRRH